MNRLQKYLKRDQLRRVLAQIVYERPDLTGLPVQQQLNTYIFDTVKGHINESKEGELPELVAKALAFDSPRSKEYYHAQLFLYREKYTRLLQENGDLHLNLYDLTKENIQAYELARDATNMVVQVRNPDNRNN